MVKKIHYCWFGGKKLPKSVEDCIKTWKKVFARLRNKTMG